MKITAEFVLREIAGEYVIIPVGENALTFNGIATVNEVGAYLWNCLQHEVTTEELAERLLEEYDVDKETAKNDVEEFIQLLKEYDVL